MRVAELAYEFRQEFNKDVVIDMVCYRRRGHNEGDDPSMTQPLMYNLIEAKRSVRKLYTESLIGRGDITRRGGRGGAARLPAAAGAGVRRDQGGHQEARAGAADAATSGTDDRRATPGSSSPPRRPPTTPPHRGRRTTPPSRPRCCKQHRRRLRRHPRRLHRAPEAAAAAGAACRDDQRGRHRLGDGRADRVRLAAHRGHAGPAGRPGQPARHVRAAARGAHRQEHRRRVDPAALPRRGPGPVLGLRLAAVASSRRWASSTATPSSGRTPWCSGRRSSATSSTARRRSSTSSSPRSEQKWGQRSSVVLLLPHGYEGQGPDHSSARIERFLQLCAEDNMTVAYPSTPASYFHLLRRQAYARPRRPLIVFTPKSMLRLKAAASSVEDFTPGGFRPVLPDPARLDPAGVTRVLLASGKVVYDLEAERDQAGGHDDRDRAGRAARPGPGRRDRRGARGLPRRRGACGSRTSRATRARGRSWRSTCPRRWRSTARPGRCGVVSRMASASPATGSHKKHEVEQENLVAPPFDR